MTTREAADQIGCSPQQVRTLIRTGKIKATKIPTETNNQHGYILNVHAGSVKSYASKPQSQGWPRGQSWEYI